MAHKGGDGIGSAGHTPQQGAQVIALLDHNGSGLASLPVAPVNAADTVLLPEGLQALQRVAQLPGWGLEGASLPLDGGCEATANRTATCHAGMIPNRKEKPRHRKPPKRGRTRLGNQAIHAVRERVARTVAWEDTVKRWLRRFAHLQQRHTTA
jgi:hypothetical protein